MIPSFYESGPLVALEALQHGLPIITRRVGIFRDFSISNKFGAINIYETIKGLKSFIQNFIDTEEFASHENISFLNEFTLSNQKFLNDYILEKLH